VTLAVAYYSTAQASESQASPASIHTSGLAAATPPSSAASTLALRAPAPLADRLGIEGDDAFGSTMREALSTIDAANDPMWTTLVSENLRGIRPARPNELPRGAFGGMLATPEGGIALFDSTRADVMYIASVLVHEAWHYKQFAARRSYHGPEAECEAMEVQAAFLSQVAPNHPAINYLLDLAARVSS
jgi:hypothetical protein